MLCEYTHTHTHQLAILLFLFIIPNLLSAQCPFFEFSEIQASGSFNTDLAMFYRYESKDNAGHFITNTCPDMREGSITLFFSPSIATTVNVCIEYQTDQYNVDVSALSIFDTYTLDPNVLDPILGTPILTQICGPMSFIDDEDCKSAYVKLKPQTYVLGQGSSFVRDIKTTISDVNNSNDFTDITLNIDNALLEQYIIAEDTDGDGHIYFTDYPTGAPYSGIATGVFFSENLIVHVDGSFVDGFSDYKYQFGSNSSLIIEPGSDLSFINGSAIEGCETLWDGITVKNGGILRLLSGTGVLDAKVAVYAEDGSDLELNNSFFINNYIGIGSDLNGGTFNFINFDDNEFRLSGLKPTNASLPTLRQAAISIAGNNGTALTAGIGSPNLFYDYFVGVNIKSSSATVSHNEFDGTTVAVNVEGTPNLVDGSVALVLSNKMRNTDAGILNGVHGLVAYENEMRNTRRGIVSSYSANRLLNVGVNDIDASRVGVKVVRSNEAFLLGNTIDMGDNPFSTGIDLSLSTFQMVRDNIVEAQEMSTGISLQTANFNTVEENTISATDAPALGTDGVLVGGSYRNEINCNLITGPGTGGEFTNSTGIEVRSSVINTYSCNDLDNTEEGFYFIGDDDVSTIEGNKLRTHSTGIKIHDPSFGGVSKTGVQAHNGNLWLEESTAFGLANYVADPTEIFESQFKLYDQDVANNMNLLPRGSVLPWNPFEMVLPEIGSGTFACLPCAGNGTGAGLIGGNLPPGGLTSVKGATVLDPNNANDDGIWIRQVNLLNTIRAYEGTPDYLPWMTGYENALSGTDVDDISTVMEIVQNVNEVNANISSSNQLLYDNITILEQLRSSGATPSQIDAAISNLTIASNSASILYAQEEQSDNVLLGQASQILQSVTTNNPVASAYVTALTHRVRYLGNAAYQLDAPSIISLQNIANECHIVYGSSVFMSRSLLEALTDDDSQYNDQQICTVSVPREAQIEQLELLDDITLFPNPVINQLSVQTDMDIVSYVIYSIDGKLIKSGNVRGATIDVSDIQKGMHLIRLLDADGVENHLSFVKN